ncbi:MAG TPA: (2Fe-2S)-binding protein [Pseudonocardiaceae bacterium]|nr:(2Fe-2S)-binding protein [Pseudonocardiaceae bacterium]
MLAEFGPFFTLAADPRAAATADLYRNSGGVLDALVDRHAARLRTTERRVAASILYQEFAARLWSPVLGCLALGRPPPDLRVRRLRWRADPFGLAVSSHGTRAATPAVLVDEHLRPMATALHDCTRVAVSLLWGNAASALVGTVTVLRLHGRPFDAGLVRDLLDVPPLRGAGTLLDGDPPAFRRRSCCLYYRLPSGGLCSDCCFTSAPSLRWRARSDGGADR